MKNIKLYLQYDGSRYLGWSDGKKSDSPRFISVRLANILEKLSVFPATLYCSQKTEKGVHALSQCVSFPFSGSHSPKELADYINTYLPADITLLSAKEAPPAFRADLYISKKCFEYRICTDKSFFPFAKDFQYLFDKSLPFEKLRAAAQLFTGKHDFSAFSISRKKKGNEKTVFCCDIHLNAHGATLSFEANDFLPGMALAIPGAILAYAKDELTLEDIRLALEKQQKHKIPFAPAHALYLKEVVYRQPSD